MVIYGNSLISFKNSIGKAFTENWKYILITGKDNLKNV